MDRAVAAALPLAADLSTDGSWKVTLAVPIEAVRQALAGPRPAPASDADGPPVVIIEGAKATPAIGYRLGKLAAPTVWIKEIPPWAKDAPRVKARRAAGGAASGAIDLADPKGTESTLFLILAPRDRCRTAHRSLRGAGGMKVAVPRISSVCAFFTHARPRPGSTLRVGARGGGTLAAMAPQQVAMTQRATARALPRRSRPQGPGCAGDPGCVEAGRRDAGGRAHAALRQASVTDGATACVAGAHDAKVGFTPCRGARAAPAETLDRRGDRDCNRRRNHRLWRAAARCRILSQHARG